MWNCPDCGKEFNKNYEWHNCLEIKLEKHFQNKPEKIRVLYDRLTEAIHDFGDIRIIPAQSKIEVSSGLTFLTIRAGNNHLYIEFLLPENVEVDTHRIYKTIKVANNRRLHSSGLIMPTEIDEELLGWLRVSYESNKSD